MSRDPSPSYRLPSFQDKPALLKLAAIGGVVFCVAAAFAWTAGWLTPQKLTPGRIINAFEAANGSHPGFRRNHAKGVCITGSFASNGGGLGVLDGKTGGDGGGGGNAGSGSGPAGGGGGGGGAILFSGNASASIRIDGLISLEGGGGGMIRSANGGPGGAGSGGSFFIDASSGQVTGTGTISVRGGPGGSGASTGTCGGGGGGGGGMIQITAPVAGPSLATLVEGGPGGGACGGGGQAGEAGGTGQLKRP